MSKSFKTIYEEMRKIKFQSLPLNIINGEELEEYLKEDINKNNNESAIQQSIEYKEGYSDGYKDGYNKALEYLIEQKKYRTNEKPIIITVDTWNKIKENINK